MSCAVVQKADKPGRGSLDQHWDRGSVWNGHPDTHRQLCSIQASGEKDAEQLKSQWVMLFLAGRVSCSRAGFLCPAEHLLGEIRAWPSVADTITPHFQLPPAA